MAFGNSHPWYLVESERRMEDREMEKNRLTYR